MPESIRIIFCARTSKVTFQNISCNYFVSWHTIVDHSSDIKMHLYQQYDKNASFFEDVNVMGSFIAYS